MAKIRILGIILIAMLLFSTGCERFFSELSRTGGDVEQALQNLIGEAELGRYNMQNRATIRGLVVDENGDPLQYVTLSVESNTETMYAHTDAQGKYTFFGVPIPSTSSSSITIQAVRTGYDNATTSIKEIKADKDNPANTANTIEMKAKSGSDAKGMVQVTIIEANSNIHLLAHVYVEGSDSSLSTYTDHSGVAILHHLAIGRTVTIKADTEWEGINSKEVTIATGAQTAPQEVEITIDGKGHDVQYDQSSEVEIWLRDKNDKPVRDARVVVTGFQDSYGGSYGSPTDFDGRCWFHGIPPGSGRQFSAEIFAGGQIHERTFTLDIQAGFQRKTVPLSDFDVQESSTRDTSVVVEFYTLQWQRVGGVEVTLAIEGHETYTGTTDSESGRLLLTGVKVSQDGSYYTLTGTKSGYKTVTFNSKNHVEKIWPQWGSGEHWLPSQQLVPVGESGEALNYILTGNVWKRHSGSQLGGVAISLVDPVTSQTVASTISLAEGETGRYTIGVANIGTYTLRAELSGYHTYTKQVSLTSSQQDLGIELRTLVSSVKFTVTQSGSGGNLEGVQVKISAMDSDLNNISYPETTGEDGVATFTNIPQGEYRLELTKSGYSADDARQYWIDENNVSFNETMTFGSSGAPSSYWLSDARARALTKADGTSYLLFSSKLASGLGNIRSKSSNIGQGLYGEVLKVTLTPGSEEVAMEYHNDLWTFATEVIPGDANAPWGTSYVNGVDFGEVGLTVSDVAYTSLDNRTFIVPLKLNQVTDITIHNNSGTTQVSWKAVTGGQYYNVVVYDENGTKLSSTYEGQNWMPSAGSQITLDWNGLDLTNGQTIQVQIVAHDDWGENWSRRSESALVTTTFQSGN